MSTGRMQRRVRELLADARQAFDVGDHSEAHALATAVLSLDPDNAEATTLLVGSDQRCQMTLMFCDLVGSTALADGIDPEELSAILRDYRSTCSDVIERFGGFIEDRKGDGLLVRFGYPWVHEDDARRAVLSALEIVAAIREHQRDLHLRIAVHTGLVVVDGGEVVGAAPNEASRIQTLAEPDTVLISDATHALVSEHFETQSLGLATLRGVGRALELYTVLGERTSAALAKPAARTPFAGRQAELATVAELWRAATTDASPAPPALLVTAPGGMGKSRLVREAAHMLGARVLVCHCSSYHRTTSLHAFQLLLQRICDVAPGDDAEVRLGKLRARLAEAGGGGDLPVLADALGIAATAISPPGDVDPSKLRMLALHAAAALVRSATADGPVMLFVDDLHWADESSLDLISVLLDDPCPGLLLALAARPAFTPPWPPTALTHVELGPLAESDLGEMLHGIAEVTSLDAEHRRALIARSDGIPLFLEELARSESALGGDRAAPTAPAASSSAIPAALRDPLLARLVIPGVDLRLSQIAATIGRDVSRELLQSSSGLGDGAFQAKLANLVAAGLLVPQAGGTIRFRHELIREVAYETQLLSARRERHSRVADLLRQGTVSPSVDAGELAFHLEQAERIAEAVEAHMDAARVNQSLGAHKEALSTLTHVLELVEQLPAGPAQLVGELTARQLRSFSAVITGGYSAPETSEDHGRCTELCEHLGLAPELLPSLIVSWSYYTSHGELAEAERVCATMERVIGDEGLSSPAVELARGVVIFFLGRFEEAHALMETFVADPWGHTTDGAPPGWLLPNDPLAAVWSHLIFTTWLTGDRTGAEALVDRALQRLAQLSFPFGPFTTGYLKSQIAIVRRLEDDHAAATQLAAEMIELGDRHGFVLWTISGTIQQLISAARLGDETALQALVETIGFWRALISIDVYTPYWLTELAGAQIAAGQPDEARATLDDALDLASRTGSDFFSAETLRIRGALRCSLGDRGGLDDLTGAVAMARRQRARAFELRAIESLELEGAGQLAAP